MFQATFIPLRPDILYTVHKIIMAATAQAKGNFVSGPAEEIVVTTGDGVVTVALNRPAKRNAVSLAMWRRLAEIFAGVGRQDGIRAVVLTGADGNFCAGADISEFATVRAEFDDGRGLRGGGRQRDPRRPRL